MKNLLTFVPANTAIRTFPAGHKAQVLSPFKRNRKRLADVSPISEETSAMLTDLYGKKQGKQIARNFQLAFALCPEFRA